MAEIERTVLSDCLFFTPLGTATSGSIYVRGRDGSEFVIRDLGVTLRARVQRRRPLGGVVDFPW